jgi:hypothetical protein
MTRRVLLSNESPTLSTIVAAFARHGPDFRVDLRSADEVRLFVVTGSLLVAVRAPLLVHTEGEAERLVGVPSPPVPYYWTELCSGSTSAAERLAAEVAETIRAGLGGRLA